MINQHNTRFNQDNEAIDNDLGIILDIIVARRKIILISVLFSIFLSMAYIAQGKTSYIATSKIMLTSVNVSKGSDILQSLVTTGKLNVSDLLSQIHIKQSPEVIEKLVIREKLYLDPEFNGSADFNDIEKIPSHRMRSIIASVRSRISISPVVGTSMVEISFEASNAIKATKITNAHVAAYSDNEEETVRARDQVATDWLAERLKSLREDVRKTEMALESAREENNLTLSQSSDSRLTKIELLTRQLSELEADYAQTTSILSSLDDSRKNNKRLDTIPQFMTDRLTENLIGQEARLIRNRAVLSQRFGPSHPEMIALNAEFEAFKDKLNEEVLRFYDTMKNQAFIQKTQIEEINRNIDQYRESYKGDSEHRLKIKNLQTEVSSARTLLNNFMASYLQSLQNLNINKKPIRVISAATSAVPSAPNAVLILMLSSITGLFFGIFLALIFERIQNTVKSTQDIEKLVGFPVYTILPKVKFTKDMSAAEYLIRYPASILAELTRTLLTTIQLRNQHIKSGGRVITLTSTYTDEGKTTTAIWLATTAAQTGKKVLIIDGDMRRPSVHKAYQIGNARGLVDYLSDRLPLEDIIYTKHVSGVHIMTSKAIPTHALTLLSSERMEAMIRRVRDMYDLILLDAPTSHVFSDAKVMTRFSDKTLFVVEWQKTKRYDLKQTVKQFTDMDYKDLFFVLNKVNDKRQMNFNESDMSYMDAMNRENIT